MRFSDQNKIPRWTFWLIIAFVAVFLFASSYLVGVNAPIPR